MNDSIGISRWAFGIIVIIVLGIASGIWSVGAMYAKREYVDAQVIRLDQADTAMGKRVDRLAVQIDKSADRIIAIIQERK